MWNESATDALVDDVMDRAERGVPVVEMGALLALGPAAAPRVSDALADEIALVGEFHPGCPYLCVVLGEMRDPLAAHTLASAVLRDDETTSLVVAAAEALGRIGQDALREIRRIAGSPLWLHRLWAYFAAGRTRSVEGNALLLAALESDPELADIAALALAESGDPQAIAPVYRALQRCEPWQRPDFEDALRDLHHGAAENEDDDWRVRFRMNALGGRFPMNWAVIACIVREDACVRERRAAVQLRPLDEILAEPRVMPAPEVCGSCGVATWLAAGVPVCPETACSIPALQARELLSFADDPDAYLVDVLDELEDERERHGEAVRRRERGRRRRGRSEAQEDESVRLRLMHSGCVWAIRQGAETVGEACLMLLDEARQAAREHGGPDDAMQMVDMLDAELSGADNGYDDDFESEPPSVPDRFAGVGRNDPCPCGSGRKFKKCHGAAGAPPADRP